MNHDYSSSITAGLDLGDRYSHLCLIDTQSGELIEESKITTSPKALQRRFSGCESMLIAIARWAPTRHGLAGCSKISVTRSWLPKRP
jgi:hypothetical protein